MKKKHIPLSGAQLIALREKHNLSQIQLGLLARTTITQRKRKSGTSAVKLQASAVQKWEDNTYPIPEDAQELIEAKLYLLETKLASLEDLLKWPLVEIMRDIYS